MNGLSFMMVFFGSDNSIQHIATQCKLLHLGLGFFKQYKLKHVIGG